MTRVWAWILALALTGAWSGSAWASQPLARASDEISAKGSDTAETALGSFVADAVRDALGADLALVHAGALAAALPKGDILAEHVAAAVPLGDDKLVLLIMNAAQLRALLERSVSLYPKANQGFLQVSGLEFSFDPAAPKFERVQSLLIAGKAPDPEKGYRLVVPGFLAQGGVGYREFRAEELDKKIGLPLIEAVINYTKKVKNLEPKTYGRITVIVEESQ